MIWARAFTGLPMPQYRLQPCGHIFNAAWCKVCPTCRTNTEHMPTRREAGALALLSREVLQACDQLEASFSVSDGQLDRHVALLRRLVDEANVI